MWDHTKAKQGRSRPARGASLAQARRQQARRQPLPGSPPSKGAAADNRFMLVADTLAFVRGYWRIERSLTDHRSGADASFAGMASFLPRTGGQAGLRYQETGDLRLSGCCWSASRSLLWLPAPGGGADVRFADGRPFHAADLRSGRWQAEHHCGDDLYHVSYHVRGPGVLAECWRVRGPRKDYLSITSLTRLPSHAAGAGPTRP